MDFYDSKKWLEKKSRILRRDGYMCQISKRYGKMIPAELVHHIFPLDEFPGHDVVEHGLVVVNGPVLQGPGGDRQTNSLTEEGRQLLERIARRNNIEVPEQYKHPIVKRNRYNGRPSTI